MFQTKICNSKRHGSDSETLHTHHDDRQSSKDLEIHRKAKLDRVCIGRHNLFFSRFGVLLSRLPTRRIVAQTYVRSMLYIIGKNDPGVFKRALSCVE
jgi:hypothetical protein